MKCFYETMNINFQFSFELPISTLPPAQMDAVRSVIVDAFAEHFREFTEQIMFERLIREIDVCNELGLC